MEIYNQKIQFSGDVEFSAQKMYLKEENIAILLIAFSGNHGCGSGGNKNSSFMKTAIAASMCLTINDGVILDLSRLTYKFGDSILQVLELPLKIKKGYFPYIILVSETCRAGLLSLVSTFGVQDVYNFSSAREECIKELARRVQLTSSGKAE